MSCDAASLRDTSKTVGMASGIGVKGSAGGISRGVTRSGATCSGVGEAAAQARENRLNWV